MADIGEIRAKIELDTTGYKQSVDKIKRETQTLNKEADNVKKSFGGVESALSALGASAALTGLIGAIKTTVNEANKLHTSIQGLSEVTKSLGGNVDATTKLAKKFVDDGLMSMADAANAVKGSLQMGLDLEQTDKLIRSLADSAAYGRAQHLSLSEAIEQGVQALRLQSSELLDNVGISKNIGTMLVEYARSVGKSSDALSEAEKNQAIYNAVLKEAVVYQGNAEKTLDGYAGAVNRFNIAMSEAKAEIGESYIPIIQQSLEQITPIIIEIAKWSSENQNLVLTIGGVAVGITSLLAVLTAGAFMFNTISAAAGTLGIALGGPVAWAIAAVTLAVGGLSLAYANMADKSNEAQRAQEALKVASQQSAAESINLAQEYDNLSRKLATLAQGTEEAKETKRRMSEIMSELESKSPGLVDAYNNQTGAVKTMTRALVENALAAVAAGKAHLNMLRQQTGSKLSDVQNKLMNYQDYDLNVLERRSLAKEQTKLQDLMANYDKQNEGIEIYKKSVIDEYAQALKLAKQVSSKSSAVTSASGGSSRASSGGGRVSSGSTSSASSAPQKSLEDIAREQYQASTRWMQYKKNLNQLSVDDEIAAYERLQDRYAKYAEIRMEIDENVYRAKSLKSQESYEASNEWIQREEQRMTLSGKTEEEITQMKLDAWKRVRDRYEKDSDYYKQADRELYNIRVQIMRDAEQALNDLDRKRADAFKALKKSVLDSLKETERDELDSIKERKDAELDVIKEREDAELESLDRRKQAIEDYYSDQVESIEDEKTAEDKQKLIAEIEKYRRATSKEGREKYNELLAELRDMEREEEKQALEKEKRDKLDALEDEERDIKESYENREREISNRYDTMYDRAQEHFESLLDEVENYTGSAEGFERLLADSRVALNADANDMILEQIRDFVDDYNDEMSRINSESDAIKERVNDSINEVKPPSSSGSNNSNSGGTSNDKKEFTGWSMNDGNIKYKVDKNGYIYKNGNFVPAENYKWIPNEVVEKARNVKQGIFHTGRDGITGDTYSFADRLLPNEISAILQDREYVFQPSQLDSLLTAVKGNGGTQVVNNYNAPLVEHNGDVRLDDDVDVTQYWRERDLLAARLKSGGERL